MSAQVIGYFGENGVRDVRIPIGHLLDKWQGLRPSLVMVPVGGSDDEAYPVQYTLEGTDLVWHVSDADTAVAGTTKAAVRMVDDDGRVGLDEPFQVIISPNLSAGGEPPVVIKPWVDKLATLVPRAESAAERAENAAQNWENGTAPNALALDSKPPEYYLSVVNLLGNSDWRVKDNIINQRKFAGGAPDSDNAYFIDRWMTYQAYPKNITIEFDGGLKITALQGRAGLKQFVETPSTDVTLAIKVNGSVHAIYSKHGVDALKNLGNGLQGRVKWNATNIDVTITGDAETTGTYTVEWMALYEGEYTAETLPPFVPRPYAIELAECLHYHLEYDTSFEATGRIDSTGDTAYFYVYTPTKMRKTPSFAPEENATGTIITPVDSLNINMADVTVLRCSGNLCVLKYTFSPAQTALAWQNCALTSYYRAALNADI